MNGCHCIKVAQRYLDAVNSCHIISNVFFFFFCSVLGSCFSFVAGVFTLPLFFHLVLFLHGNFTGFLSNSIAKPKVFNHSNSVMFLFLFPFFCSIFSLRVCKLLTLVSLMYSFPFLFRTVFNDLRCMSLHADGVI
jgi:hypothetical protein